MSSQDKELRIEAALANLAAVARFITTCCEQGRVDDEDAYKIQLAVDEAVTNIIEHAYEGKGGEIVLRCWFEGQHFHVQLTDWGKGFSMEDVPAPILSGPLSERKTGGLGLYFMQQMMDEIHFESDRSGNVLHMVKHDVSP